jgi:hypothetical protein
MAILNPCQVFGFIEHFHKNGVVPNGVLRGYDYGRVVVWSTWRVLPRSWEMVVYDGPWLTCSL